MDKTPEGNHEIRKITGEPSDIESRGRAIASLGVQMKEAAGVLDLIKDGAETRGKSLESIKDSVGDAAKDLKKAGERYEPSGTHIHNYGLALSVAQSWTDGIVTESERLWAIYETKAGAFGDASDTPVPDPDVPVAEGDIDPTKQRQDGIDTAAGEKQVAYDDWKLEAGKYDIPYENWATAYEDARKGLQAANDDGVEDGFWDNALPAIDMILKVLSYAGILLAIAAIIIGGPFIAILAAVVGVLTLVLTVIKYAKGRGSLTDVFVAAICILPFGKIVGAFKGVAKAAPGAKGLAAVKGLKEVASETAGLTNLRQLRSLRNLAKDPSAIRVLKADGTLNQNGTKMLRQRMALLSTTTNSGSIRNRLLYGADGALGRNAQRIVDGGSQAVQNRLPGALANTPSGRVVQDLLDAGGPASRSDVILNLTDGVAKPGGNFLYDQR